MASTRKASIAAEIRADRSKFKADLAAAKQDARRFGTEVKKEFAVASDITLAAKMKELRGETLKAKDDVKALAAEYVRLKTAHAGFKPIQRQATGLSFQPGMGPQQPFQDPAFVLRTRTQMQGLARDTLSANTAMMQGGRGATNAGMGMLFLAQGIDDAQYGFRSIVNNIAPLVMALGGGPGLAGALTIAAVGFNLLGKAASDAWDDMTGETQYQKLLQQNEQMEEMHGRRLTRLREEAKLAGERAQQDAAWMQDQKQQHLALQQEELQNRQQLLEAEHAIARARAEAMPEGQRAAALTELEKQQAAEKLAIEKRFWQDRIANSRFQGEHQAGAERRALEEEMQGIDPRTANERLQRRRAELPGLIAAARTREEASIAENRTNQAGMRGVTAKEQQLVKENELRDLKLTEENKKRGEEIAKEGLRRTVQFFEDMHRRAKEANDADEKAWKLRRDHERKERAMLDEQTRLQIQTLRSKGRDKEADALQGQADLSAETQRLTDLGFKPQVAAQMAAQGQANEARGSRGGRRRIQGAVSRNRRSGLDGEFLSGSQDFMQNGIGFNFGQQRTPLQNEIAGVRNRRRAAEASGDDGQVSALKQMESTLSAKLDELISNTAKTAGERTAPRHRN